MTAQTSPDLHRTKPNPQLPALFPLRNWLGSPKLRTNVHRENLPNYPGFVPCLQDLPTPPCLRTSWQKGTKEGTESRIRVPENHVGAKLADAAGPVALRAGEESNMGATGHKDVTS